MRHMLGLALRSARSILSMFVVRQRDGSRILDRAGNPILSTRRK